MSGRRALLVVDDDRLLCRSLQDHFATDFEVRVAHTLAQAAESIAEGAVDVALLDQRLPDGGGESLCAPLLQAHPGARIIATTAYPSFESAVGMLRAGAHDFLRKPFELEELALALRHALESVELKRLERLGAWRSERASREDPLVGGRSLDAVRQLVRAAAPSSAPVLVTGETGTGKNIVARTLHEEGPRRARPFVPLNCAALPESLVEAELFGWERGAFTGAAAAREGVVEMAEGGTLFLDEIGEMAVSAQAKLLAMLEDGEIRRLGGRVRRAADVRVVAATNADLEDASAHQRFRRDLYYRLDVVRIRLPPLRERTEDLPALCATLLARACGGPGCELAQGEVERLAAYPWPGNIRELRNVMERACIVQRPPLRPSLLLNLGAPAPVLAPIGEAPVAPPSDLTLAELERQHIEAALRRCSGNVTLAARTLGISLSTLKRRVRDSGLAGTVRDARADRA